MRIAALRIGILVGTLGGILGAILVSAEPAMAAAAVPAGFTARIGESENAVGKRFALFPRFPMDRIDPIHLFHPLGGVDIEVDDH
jgi:hypothetical protein